MAKPKKQVPKAQKAKLPDTKDANMPDTKATTQKLSRRAQKQIKAREKEKAMKWEFPLSNKNMIVMGIGLAVILVGYILMATGMTEEPAVPDGKWNNPFAVVIAPVLLVLGYLVIIPYGIMKVFGKKDDTNETSAEQQPQS